MLKIGIPKEIMLGEGRVAQGVLTYDLEILDAMQH